MGAWGDPNVAHQLLIPARPGLRRIGARMTEQLWHKLIAAHANEAVDGVHGRPLIAQGPGPGDRVEIVGIGERPVYVEEDPRPELIGHAGGSASLLIAAFASPVRTPPIESGLAAGGTLSIPPSESSL